MHELSICQSMLNQIEAVAMENRATAVHRVKVQVGPLSGVEPQLLQQAFPIAVAGSIAETAVLEIELLPIRLECRQCGAESEAASANKLVCGQCGHWQTRLLSGDEMLLASLELDRSTAEQAAKG
ncbi:MAG: hydrogenase maturation nickel metallochaperone HypA [Thiohalophilus sp.]|uniref:hydrogenase maturation nickel metallochaperone HypA n=1 Tax=Thiohalophilus sp. TaxID=3028392 RepID=UPI00286FFEC3|nr:hydrogenase maturation nickel metallochaperone HypA [Thiohalophilus sp.]MDR9435801.1 hydrogenase maturation nickel metallochaperone HypA [Thiohalophilus sp.]